MIDTQMGDTDGVYSPLLVKAQCAITKASHQDCYGDGGGYMSSDPYTFFHWAKNMEVTAYTSKIYYTICVTIGTMCVVCISMSIHNFRLWRKLWGLAVQFPTIPTDIFKICKIPLCDWDTYIYLALILFSTAHRPHVQSHSPYLYDYGDWGNI
jgi:hypothetical protein